MKDEIKEILEDVKRHLDYVEATKQCSIRDNEMKAMYDYITNLQEENGKLKKRNKEIYDGFIATQEELSDYATRNEKANWWLKEMLKQAKSNETKAIINGTLELLLNGGDEE